MVVVFIISDWIFVLMNTATMMPCRRSSKRELPIVNRSHRLPVLQLILISFISIHLRKRMNACAVSDLYGCE